MNHRRKRGGAWWSVLLAALCGGCANLGTEFTVTTTESDPVIYGPGTGKGRPLVVPLEELTLGCEEATINLDQGSLRLYRRFWADSRGFRKTLVAELDQQATVYFATTASDAHETLVSKLVDDVEVKKCKLGHEDKELEGSSAFIAAELIRRHLPRAYSSALRYTYNHQIWPKRKENGIQDKTYWVSLDLFPGMRLRLENSLPISPEGIFTRNAHPSSFAAPTYLYFHSLSGSELCDPGSKPITDSPNYYCTTDKKLPREDGAFVSASGGLARLGLVQKKEGVAGTFILAETSGLIDLLERTDAGDGAWHFWRLWLPSNRETLVTSENGDGVVSSSEPQNNSPLLIAGNTLADLGALKSVTSSPCESTTKDKSRCHHLRYRVVPIPEITVIVNGVPQWVPIGTTLLDLLDHRLHDPFFAPRPASLPRPLESMEKSAAGYSAAHRRALADVQVFRRHQGGLHAVLPTALETGEQLRRFLRLQLLPGDEIKWQ